jgi:hypothetical protein
MKLKLKTPADIVGFTIRRNKSHDGREAAVDLEIGVKQDDASKWGEDFKALAFATMRVMEHEKDGGNSVAFLVDSIKPGHRVVFERHTVNIAGQKINEQPELLSIRTVDGEARVVARIRLPVAAEKAALISELVTKVSQTVRVEFEPQQGQFEFTHKADDKTREAAARAVQSNPGAAKAAVESVAMQ